METIRVELGRRSYPIMIEKGLLARIAQLMRELRLSGKAALITNPRLAGLFAEGLKKDMAKCGFDPILITVPDGEEYKNLTEASKIYDRLIEHRMERGSPLIAVGGGVIGDMTGFVAATYLRGVPFVQVPTTLLAQVDSSVGGKTGVNHPKGKNLIGAFYQPRAVFIDPDVLKSLEAREIRAGAAEVVKYGIIRDERFFGFLEENAKGLFDGGDGLAHAIKRSCEIKAEVVGSDETEQDLRAILNFGHTFGHAIEAITGYGTYRHGEAISIGMAMASHLAVRLGMLKKEDSERVGRLLASFALPVDLPNVRAEEMMEAIRLDKKVSSGRLRFILPEGIGRVAIKEVPDPEVLDFLKKIRVPKKAGRG